MPSPMPSDHFPRNGDDRSSSIGLSIAADAVAATSVVSKLAAIEHQLVELNALLATIPDADKRRFGLYEHYALGAYDGVVYCSGGVKAVYDPMRTDPAQRARIYHSDSDREALRSECRRQRMPERMIWDRFPPHTAAETADMRKRVGDWDDRHPPPGGKEPQQPQQPPQHLQRIHPNDTPDNFTSFLHSSARRAGDKSLANNPTFREACLREWNEIEDLEINL